MAKFKFIYCLSPGFAYGFVIEAQSVEDGESTAQDLAVKQLEQVRGDQKLVAELKTKAERLLPYMDAKEAREKAPFLAPLFIEAAPHIVEPKEPKKPKPTRARLGTTSNS